MTGMEITPDIRNQFKKLVEIYQEMIDDCTDLNINNSILNGELNLWYT
jgi:predicted helicase